ncbi:MAG: ribosome biogenesis GTPase Der [Phycisphaeraceae bacterium]
MLPKVVIIGRPNVGKSSLLNMLAQRRISIVDPTPGVTRDRISTMVALPVPLVSIEPRRNPARRVTAKEKALRKVRDATPKAPGEEARQPMGTPAYIELIDTGGYGIEDVQKLTTHVEAQIALGMAEADLILFVVDAQTGIMPLDKEVARLLRQAQGKKGKPVMLIANKVDSEKLEADALEATRLGLGPPLCVSALSGHNRHILGDAIRARIDWRQYPDATSEPSLGTLLAIVGKRNAGKSTLVNALVGQDRVIVSELEGTTRDSVDVRFQIGDQVLTAIDTAGLRKGKSVKGDIDYYSQHRALRSIRRANVVLFLIDATLPLSNVDEKLSTEIQRQFKPVVIVVNKWDLAPASSQEQYLEYLDKGLKGLDFAPVAFVSAKQGEGLRELVAMAMNLYQQAGHRVGTAELNRTLEEIIATRPPSSSIGRRPKIYYVTQLDVHPPTIGLFVNDQSMFDPTYQRYLINRFRELLPFSETPIKLLIRGKPKPGEGE